MIGVCLFNAVLIASSILGMCYCLHIGRAGFTIVCLILPFFFMMSYNQKGGSNE